MSIESDGWYVEFTFTDGSNYIRFGEDLTFGTKSDAEAVADAFSNATGHGEYPDCAAEFFWTDAGSEGKPDANPIVDVRVNCDSDFAAGWHSADKEGKTKVFGSYREAVDFLENSRELIMSKTGAGFIIDLSANGLV